MTLHAALTALALMAQLLAPDGRTPLREALGYDAVSSTTRRKAITVNLKTEDDVLKPADRDSLTSAARDLRRNSSLCAWLIRKHLDFVSRFSFQATSDDPDFNRQLEKFVGEWTRPENFDVAGRHGVRRFMRLTEAHRVVDGDVLHVRLKASKRLQAIVGSRIRNPAQRATPTERWANGVRITPAGRHIGYAVWTRNQGGTLQFERVVSAQNAVLHGYYDSFEQARGVSPLATAVNQLRDVYTNIDLALARARVDQLLAVAFTTEPNPEPAFGQPDVPGNATVTDYDDDGDGNTDRQEVTVDFGDGPVTLNLDPGEDVKFLQGANPSSQFQTFHESVIAIALLALDLPYTFLDVTKQNFVSGLAQLQLYKASCETKQDENRDLLRSHTLWRLAQAVLEGELALPRGMTVGDVPFEWIPAGIPWWDRSKEITGALKAIAAGLDNPQRVAREHGLEFKENVDRIAEALAYSRDKLEPFGVQIRFDASPELQLVTPVDA